jgi:hypothetical protein
MVSSTVHNLAAAKNSEPSGKPTASPRVTGYARTRNAKFRIGLDYSHRRGFKFCTESTI